MALDTTVSSAGTAADAGLRLPVWNALADRGDALRRALPRRPDDVLERAGWWRSLSGAQARDTMLLDRLDALCGHLAGRPAPGYAAAEPLPAAALEEAEGFLNGEMAEMVTEVRHGRGALGSRRPG